MTTFKCDCGKQYTPAPRRKDLRVKCEPCVKRTKSHLVKKRAVDYLGGRCKDCGFQGHPVAFDFDHKNPQEKSFRISGNAIFRWEEIRRELDKCELRCANCHRIRHYTMDHVTE